MPTVTEGSKITDQGTTHRVSHDGKFYFTEQNLDIVNRKGCSPKLLIPAAVGVLGIAGYLAVTNWSAISQFVTHIVGK